MKKIGFLLIPLLAILFSTMVMPRLLAGGMNPSTMVIIGAVVLLSVAMIRPKKGPSKSSQQLLDEILDDYSKDAFEGHEALNKKFQSAVNDISSNLPKSAGNKLRKLAEECVTDPQKYAVAMASAMTYRLGQDWKNVIREYNKAIVLHPTDFLAYQIGDCHQRLGSLEKARDSYEFAMELDPQNPQYPSSLGTVCVGEGDYDAAIDYAQEALLIDEHFSQALATLAICYGVKNDSVMHRHYADLAVSEGYSQEKIDSTVKALKKRNK